MCLKMRTIPVLFAWLLGCLVVGGGNAEAGTPLSIGSQRDVAGGTAVTITNNTDKTATALGIVLSYSRPAAAGRRALAASAAKIYDVKTEPLAAKAVLPKQQITLLISGVFTSSPDAPQLAAVLFNDNSHWGDERWVTRLRQRRLYMERSLRESVGALRIAAAQQTERSDLAAEFQSAQEAELTRASDEDERACIRSVRSVVLMNLQHVLTARDGTPVAVSAVIQHELVALERRLAALEDR
jgi:hypothetical protein